MKRDANKYLLTRLNEMVINPIKKICCEEYYYLVILLVRFNPQSWMPHNFIKITSI